MKPKHPCLEKLFGKHTDWYYLTDETGSIIGYAHEDDKEKLAKLAKKLKELRHDDRQPATT